MFHGKINKFMLAVDATSAKRDRVKMVKFEEPVGNQDVSTVAASRDDPGSIGSGEQQMRLSKLWPCLLLAVLGVVSGSPAYGQRTIFFRNNLTTDIVFSLTSPQNPGGHCLYRVGKPWLLASCRMASSRLGQRRVTTGLVR